MSKATEERVPEPGPATVAEFLQFVYPPAKSPSCPCPPWPPDVFAIVATLMRRTGVYVRSVQIGDRVGGDDSTMPSGEEWRRRARKVGKGWRGHTCEKIDELTGEQRKLSFRQAVGHVAVPDEVAQAWKMLLVEAARTTLEDCSKNATLCNALIELNAFADEASPGIGLPWPDRPRDSFCGAASFFLTMNQRRSFCCAVDRQKACVLGKKHTPQHGLTLRSTTHHLSLCMPWEVEAQWFDFDAPHVEDVLNLLLLPWPLEVGARDFSLSGTEAGTYDDREHRTFTYSRPAMDPTDLRTRLDRALDAALKNVSRVHAVVLPELALLEEEWNIAQQVALARGLLLIAGIADGRDEATGQPVNSCRVQLATLDPKSGGRNTGVPQSAIPPLYSQAKHHRWCLDRNQVLQYDLGGQLPSTLRCWEHSYVDKRNVFFATIGGWLTFSVLICEDLARQDPIAEILRSVAPNLVIALLMDGPQLAARWPARYAAVLADDPGSSVLTLTSLGMCTRSKPPDRRILPPSRVIALWKDKLYGTQEIALDETANACVLSVSCENREEFTADGRSDRKATQVPVFSGIFQIHA